jgi:thymidylate synthase
MQQYQQLLLDLMQKGTAKDSARANMPQTRSIFGYQFRHNLQDGFPAITTKELYWKGVVAELIWFMSGDTNIKYLDDCGARKMWHISSC